MRLRMIPGVCAVALACAGGASGAPILSEGFDDITTLPGLGWVRINNSVPLGNDWFQGNAGIFVSQSGANDSYIADSFLSTSSVTGVVDAWLISPEVPLPSGGILNFYTRTADPGFLDLLEVRFSVGPGTGTGGFATLLGTIGDVTPYPDSGWTAFSFTLPSAASGRFAFRYTVNNALDADYIGIDTVTVDAAEIPEPSTYALVGVSMILLGLLRRRALPLP